MMESICRMGVRATALFMAACILKCALPEGNMKRSAEKAVDMAVLAGLASIIAGVTPNG